MTVTIPPQFKSIMSAPLIYGFRMSMLWFFAIGALATFLLVRTRFGNWVQARGQNEQAARNLGVPVDRLTIYLFMIASALAAVTGVIQVARFSSVETMLKSAAYIRAAGGVGRSCEILRASLPLNLPWILSIMIVSKNGLVQCSTLNKLVGLDLSDREYFKQARETGGFVFSDFLFAKSSERPIVMAAYPVSAINREEDAIVVAGINLDWMSKIMSNLGSRPGVSAVLVDGAGVVLAAPADQASMIGRPLDTVAEKVIGSDQPDGSLSFADGEGSKRIVHFVRIPGTQSRLVVSIDESSVTAAINREIRSAYLQLLFVCLFVLLGALVAAEKLIIRPINMMVAMAKRFGEGDWSVRAARNRLPAEFVPLARAFNAMAERLIERERELVTTNERLTVIASIDMLSGLANRRGFQSRLDFADEFARFIKALLERRGFDQSAGRDASQDTQQVVEAGPGVDGDAEAGVEQALPMVGPSNLVECPGQAGQRHHSQRPSRHPGEPPAHPRRRARRQFRRPLHVPLSETRLLHSRQTARHRPSRTTLPGDAPALRRTRRSG